MSSLSFTLIQSTIHWENAEANIKMLSDKIRSVKNPEIVILPEMFTTGFSMRPEIFAEKMDGKTVEWMRKTAAEKKIILTGSLMIGEEEHYYNRLIWMLPNGELGTYDKRHLFAYSGEDKQYCSGQKRLITSVKGWKILLQICYDLRFPVWSRQTPLKTERLADPFGKGSGRGYVPEYDVIIYVANWPERRNHAWKSLLMARAIENQCYVIGVNRVGIDANQISYSGNSMVIDPLGEVLYHKAEEEDIHTIILDKLKLDEIRKKFPFLQDGDRFTIQP